MIDSWSMWRKNDQKEGSQKIKYLGSPEVPAYSIQRSTLWESQCKGAWAAGTYSLWVPAMIGIKKKRPLECKSKQTKKTINPKRKKTT